MCSSDLLLGASDPVAGTGTVADPWRVPLATVGPVTLALTAWRGTPDPQLHLGLRASGSTGTGAATVAGALDSEIVALAFPDSAPVTARVLGHHEARISVTGPFSISPLDGAGIGLAGADARIKWKLGEGVESFVDLNGLTVHLDDADVTVPALRLPPPAGFAPDQPDLGLGLPVADLDRLARALLSRLWRAHAGDAATLAGGLLGLNGLGGLVGLNGLGDLPADWPGLALPDGGVGGLLADPLAAVRAWLVHVALDEATDATGPFIWSLLDGLRGLVRPDGATPDVDSDVVGAGS